MRSPLALLLLLLQNQTILRWRKPHSTFHDLEKAGLWNDRCLREGPRSLRIKKRLKKKLGVAWSAALFLSLNKASCGIQREAGQRERESSEMAAVLGNV